MKSLGKSFLCSVLGVVMLAALAGEAFAQCGGCPAAAKGGASACSAVKAAASTTLCGKCGEVKGADKCCAADAKRCGCGAIKGSPGCCNLAKSGKDLTLCKCGAVKGSDKCCDKSAKRCGCGAIKGTPGCKLGCAEKKAAKG